MKEKVNVLIIGDAYSPHIYRIIKHLYNNSDRINIDLFNYYKKKAQNPDISEFCNKIYYITSYFPTILYKIPILNAFLSILDFKFTFKKKINFSYNFIHIHFITIHSIFLSYLYKKRSNILVLTTWGSDVLRASPLKLLLMKKLFKNIDYITLSLTGYRDKLQSIFKFPDSKILDVRMGSEMIDELEKNQDIDTKDSKHLLGLENKYIITIGYNGSKAQNHLKVIEQINLVKDLLPSNLHLMLPMTYPTENHNYIEEIKNKIEEFNLSYVIYDNHLSNEKLLTVRKCTDVFIHAQTTDATAASVQEYILTDCIVINASWLGYPHLEKYGKPYFTFNKFDEIGETLLYAIDNKDSIKVSEHLKVDLYNRGWDKAIITWINIYLNTSEK